MAHHGWSGFLPLGLLLLVLSGCAPVISPQIRQEAAKAPPFSAVAQNPTAHKGSMVVWGGSILQTENYPKSTQILVLEIPLGYDRKPKAEENSQGRFIAETPRFLDPAIYRKGMRITVAGEVVGTQTRPLDKTEYTYPVIRIREIHLWKEQRVVYPPPYYWGHWNYYRGPWGWYGWPYYRPYYW